MNKPIKFLIIFLFVFIFAVGTVSIGVVSHELFHRINTGNPINTCFLGISEDHNAVGWVYGSNIKPENNEANAYIVEILLILICLVLFFKFIWIMSDKD